MSLHIQLGRFFLALFLATAATEMDKVALQELGSVLGLPVNNDALAMKREDFPLFLNNVYNCWTSNPDGDCLPGYHGKDVNLLRTFLGSGTFF